MKIGYQGMEGSNAHVAAMELAKSQRFEGVEYVGLISSINVVNELEKGNIDYGVVATKNSIGGEVVESMNALRNRPLELVATHILPIILYSAAITMIAVFCFFRQMKKQ